MHLERIANTRTGTRITGWSALHDRETPRPNRTLHPYLLGDTLVAPTSDARQIQLGKTRPCHPVLQPQRPTSAHAAVGASGGPVNVGRSATGSAFKILAIQALWLGGPDVPCAARRPGSDRR